ncbi:MAG: GumC family protein [Phycisphaerales bacterium]
MTTMPPVRTPPIPSRPAQAGTAPSGGPATASAIPTLDPIKLVKKYKWLLMATTAAGIFLGTVAHFVLLRTFPVFTSYIVYECAAQEGEVGSLNPSMNFRDELDKFMATQVQVMISDRVVQPAVQDPQMDKIAGAWTARFKRGNTLDTSKAVKALKKRLGASIVGESNFLRLSFWDTDPDLAKAVVEVVGGAYIRDRKNSAAGEINDRKGHISTSISQINDSISALQKNRSRLLVDQTVESLDDKANQAIRQMTAIDEKLVEVRADKEVYIVQRDQLLREQERPIRNYTESLRKRVEQDPSIQSMMNTINTLKGELTAMKQRLGERHRDVVQLTTRINGLSLQMQSEREKLLAQEFEAQLDSLSTAVTSVEAQEADMMKKFNEAKDRAAELTQTLAQVKDLDREIDRSTDSKAKLQDDLKSIDILGSMRGTSRIVQFQPAERPKVVTFPKLYIMAPAGMALLLGLVGGVVLVMEIVDQRVKSPADVALIPRTRVLGLVPHAQEDPTGAERIETVFRDRPYSVLSESFRQLRVALLKRMQGAGHRSLVVMSGMPGSGATTVVTNLAYAFASADQTVLVIDANFRRPAIHRYLGLAEAPGLADVLAGQATLDTAAQTTDNPNIKVLTAGSAGARAFERLSTRTMTELLREASSRFDLVLLDVAPAMIAGDALAIAARCDASMLVVRAMAEKRGMVARLRNELSDAKAEFTGVLVNAVRSAAGGYLRGNILASHRYQNNGTEPTAKD